jgi:hypothetical protein
VERNVTVRVAEMPPGFDAPKIVRGLEEYPIGPERVTVPLEEGDRPELVMLFADRNGSETMLYGAVVLPGDTNVTFDAVSTAVSWSFIVLGAGGGESPASLRRLRDWLRGAPETAVLAERIDRLLRDDPESWMSGGDPGVKEALGDVVAAVAQRYRETAGAALTMSRAIGSAEGGV